MPYPFVPGESLTSANLNAALDMRVRTDGSNLSLVPGAVLFGSATGGFASDATNLTFDDTNNRLGVNNNTPQAMLSVGKTAGTARVYNSYTDTANGEWADLSWAGNVLSIGSNKNGTGLARAVNLVAGGVVAAILDISGNTTFQRTLGVAVGQAFRAYNTFTDASNYEAGEVSWSGNVVSIGSSRAGTGVARAVSLMAGGVAAISLEADADTVILKSLGLNGQTPGSCVDLRGTYTNAAQNILVNIAPTFASGITTNQYGLQLAPTIQPTGASLTNARGLYSAPAISGSVPITAMDAILATTTITSYTGTDLSEINGLNIFGPSGGSATNYSTTYRGIRVQATTNANGLTSGSVNNNGLVLDSHTAAAAVGGTLTNRGLYVGVPTGSGAGTTTNSGIHITGNGGSGGAGTTTNWALYSDSTANSVFFGKLGLNGTTPVVPLHLAGTFTDAAQVTFASFTTTMVLAATGTQYGMNFSPTFQPSGASLSQAVGILSLPKLAGSVAITEIDAIYARADLATYSGANPNLVTGFTVDTPSGGSSTKYATNCYGVYVAPITNGNSLTSSSISNFGLVITSITAGAGTGGGVNNRGISLSVPNGGGAGTTNNYGIYITGNGGSGAGTITNLAIYSDSTAMSWLVGGLRVGSGVNPTNATSPFLFTTVSAGQPTGAPTYGSTAFAAIQWDSTNKKLWVWDGTTSTWKGVVLA